MMNQNLTYEKPEITILVFDKEQSVMLSGYLWLSEGFGDEVLW